MSDKSQRTPLDSLLAQFTKSNTAGYQPQPQATASTYSQNTQKPTTTTTTTTTSNQIATKLSNTFQPLAPQLIDLKTFKGFKFVTLDGLVIETRSVYDEISGTYKWEMCESQEDRCIDFIRNKCTNKRTFFISSGGLGKSVIPKIHELPQVYAIYIYCADVIFHQEWASKFSKIRVVCNDDDKVLLPQLAVDVAQANVDWGNALVTEGNRAAAKEKFEKALANLTKYARNPDENMIHQIIRKLDELK
ncbi:unnamed protein product [Rotaria magnacalcarata]|uniref:Uncharacterized protein n=4 Tax=Rotaria magnacalcarata TaxID=392030 RepID=A0A814ZRI4_9BILA|nr:unnamed protein product [Rotaria magnacalcarata]CAF1352831.1 unnamed protein product [Rotaria magnacalcarata]CAF2094662.1 unnamed protein product [Rotaria magnacalcarata]CAF3735225.1 unnamed protein product [Rotaria magnacalcarata]CAF3988317.1 unnamed protein product [Rotaria magnacalcarata]